MGEHSAMLYGWEVNQVEEAPGGSRDLLLLFFMRIQSQEMPGGWWGIGLNLFIPTTELTTNGFLKGPGHTRT